MVKKQEQKQEAKNVWEYADWLYNSGRLTAEEHNKLKWFLVELEDEIRFSAESNCGC